MFTIENLENRFVKEGNIKPCNPITLKYLFNILVPTLSQFIHAAITEYHKLGGLNKKHLSTVWEFHDQSTGRFVVWWGLASCVSGHLLCPHIVEGAKELSGIFYKIINLPSKKLHTCDLITFWRLHLQIPLHWGLGFKREFWGTWVHGHSVLSLYVYLCVYVLKGSKRGHPT